MRFLFTKVACRHHKTFENKKSEENFFQSISLAFSSIHIYHGYHTCSHQLFKMKQAFIRIAPPTRHLHSVNPTISHAHL